MNAHPTGSSATERASTVVRLSGPQGLALAVPQHLGFHPTRSLVMLCLTAPRGRVGPVARVDLYAPDRSEVTAQLVGCAVRYADAVAVLCYHDGVRPACLDALLDGLTAAGVAVTDALSVADGMIRRAESAEIERDDPGMPLPDSDDAQASRLAAATALAGRRTLPSREALARSVAAPGGAAEREARAAIDAARVARRGRDGGIAQRHAAAKLLDRAMDQQRRRGAPDARTAADLVAFCDAVTGRDLLIAEAIARDKPEVVAMLISVAARTPDDDAPGPCSVLAVAAYRFGDGALAHCALDRVLARAPDHRLAHLMLSAIAGGLPPRELAAMATIGQDGDECDGDGYDRGDDARVDPEV